MPQAMPSVTFRMSLSMGWFGRFSGTVIEDEAGIPEPAVICGSVHGTKIEFRKWYPSFWFMNYDVERIRLPRQVPWVLRYCGDITDNSTRICGGWEIPAEIRNIDGEHMEFACNSGA